MAGMTQYERVANKIIGLFADMRLSRDDIKHIAFYVVQNSTDEIIDRILTFANDVKRHNLNKTRYTNDTLF